MMAVDFGGLAIDPVEFGSQGTGILGIRDSGKTYTATLLAERLFDAGIPFIAFDPIGVWRFLRVPGKGHGYPVVIAGGEAGDLPLSPASAPAIVEAAMQQGVSLVIDLFSMDLSKRDWKRIVRDCVRLLLHKNKAHGLRHVFIEEASEFVPQRVIDGDVYAEVEKLARMGGNSRLGYTLINQRAEEVNKAVLELCDNLFLHRQKGRNSLVALSKWLDVGNVKDHKEIIGTLSTLPTGECWAWLGGTERPVHVKVPEKNSLHPDRRAIRGDDGAIASPPVDVNSFVESMQASLKALEPPAVSEKPTGNMHATMLPDPKALEEAERRGFDRGYERAVKDCAADLDVFAEVLAKLNDTVQSARSRSAMRLVESAEMSIFSTASEGVKIDMPSNAAEKRDKRNTSIEADVSAENINLPAPQQRILRSLSFWRSVGEQHPTRKQVAAVAGYSPGSGGFNNLLGSLRTQGVIDYPDSGRVLLIGDTGKAMSAREARDIVLSTLSQPQQKIVSAVPRGKIVSREAVAAATGYSAGSGGFNNLLGSLRTLDILTYPAKGKVALSAWAGELMQ